jgi:hypothetical protein
MSVNGQAARYTAVRTALIGYGTAAYSYLLARPEVGGEAKALATGVSAGAFVLSGVVLQILLVFARIAINRFASDRSIADRSLQILELIGDGVTVLLFALATLGAVVHAPEQF